MKNIIFIAPPAAGKGTLSKMLTDAYSLPHISTGDLLRERSAVGDELGMKIKSLIDNGIFCNVHWRLEESENQPELTFLTRHSMTIPCDQRYGKAEMNYIVDVLKRWKDK